MWSCTDEPLTLQMRCVSFHNWTEPRAGHACLSECFDSHLTSHPDGGLAGVTIALQTWTRRTKAPTKLAVPSFLVLPGTSAQRTGACVWVEVCDNSSGRAYTHSLIFRSAGNILVLDAKSVVQKEGAEA